MTHNKTDDLYERTHNQMGYMTTKLDELAHAFLDFAEKSGGPSLEIGAAFGKVALEAANRKIPITVNDLDPSHLDHMLDRASPDQKPYLTLKVGHFPNEIMLEKNTFSSILICRVLHFFPPEMWMRATNKLFDCLLPGGKLFMTNESPYFGTMREFIPIYQKRKKNGHPWPGLVLDMSYFDKARKQAVNSTINLLSKEETQATLEDIGFHIEQINYINRRGVYPDDALYDGREAIGVIAQKPFNCE